MLGVTLLIYAVAFFLSVFFNDINIISYVSACTIHEFAHTFCAECLSVKSEDPKISFMSAKISVMSEQNIRTFLIAIAGPVANILSSILCAYFVKSLNIFAYLSFALAIINLLPIKSLDGYTALYAMLPTKLKPAVPDIISEILTFSILVFASFRMLKYGDSVFAFFFALIGLVKHINRANNQKIQNWN